jgi:hypothetical protein
MPNITKAVKHRIIVVTVAVNLLVKIKNGVTGTREPIKLENP